MSTVEKSKVLSQLSDIFQDNNILIDGQFKQVATTQILNKHDGPQGKEFFILYFSSVADITSVTGEIRRETLK